MLHGPSQHFDEVGRGRRVLRLTTDKLVETSAFDELEAEVELPFEFADFVDLHDIRMAELCNRLGFLAEPAAFFGVGANPADHFQGNEAFQTWLPGLVDDALAASSDATDDLESRDARKKVGVDLKRHGWRHRVGAGRR